MIRLGINLHEEDQVDYLLRTLAHLKFLNGIEVEREALFDSSEEEVEESQSNLLEVNEQKMGPILDESGSNLHKSSIGNESIPINTNYLKEDPSLKKM